MKHCVVMGIVIAVTLGVVGASVTNQERGSQTVTVQEPEWAFDFLVSDFGTYDLTFTNGNGAPFLILHKDGTITYDDSPDEVSRKFLETLEAIYPQFFEALCEGAASD